MKQQIFNPALLCELLYLSLLLGLLTWQTTAYADSAVRQYDIPAGSMASAVNQLAETGNIQAIYDTQVTQGRVSKGLKGSYSTETALQKLLAGTGLVYTLSDGTVTIRTGAKPVTKPFLPVANPSPTNPEPMSETTLPKVTVEADSAYDPEYYADPYNKDYVIPNATAGTKTDTPIMETPLNVQVISKQVLKDQQVIRLDQALKNVSGVTTNTTSNFGSNLQSILIRGFASQTFFRNGFRLQQGATNREMANVESIEVLKGSAAGLYGLVDPGGMVNVITKQPLATPYYGFTQQFGSYDLYRSTLDATGSVTKDKNLLYRVNMSYENSGSFRDFVTKEDVFFAPVLKWAISPRTQATLELEYDHQQGGLDSIFLPLFNGKPIDMPRSRNYGEYSPITTETIFGSFNWSHQFNDDWSIKQRFSVNQQSVSQPHYVFPNNVANGQVDRLLATASAQYNTYSTNLDLIGHFDTFGLNHTLLIGGDYYRLNTKSITDNGNISQINLFNPVHPGTPFQQPSGYGISASDNQQDQFGFYIQDQIKLPHNVQLMGGIRYQYLHQNNQDLVDKSSSGRSDDAVTPRVGFLWQPKNWLMLYANYMESFGPNDLFASIYPGTLPPPTSAQQYEGGIKTEFFGGRLRATLAYYDLTKTNVATRDPNPTHICAGSPCSVTVGEVPSRGPELDITGEILPGWNIIATYTNMDARVTKSNDDASSPTAVGDRFFNTPRNTGSVWSTYEFLDGDFKGLKFGGGVKLQDGQIGWYDKPAAHLPGYATVDLLAAYSLDVGKTKITTQFNVNNLLDKHYYSGLTTNWVGLTGYTAAYADFGQPRTFMGSINIQY